MATQPFIFSRPSDVEDTKETCIARLANGERMRGCMRTVEYLHGWHTPNYPVPALPLYASWGNDVSHVTVWNGAMQIRISDEYLYGDYTGFGAVITFDHFEQSVGLRYDDFD